MIISKDLLILVRSKHEMKRLAAKMKSPVVLGFKHAKTTGNTPRDQCLGQTKRVIAIRAIGGLISVQDSTIYDEIGARL